MQFLILKISLKTTLTGEDKMSGNKTFKPVKVEPVPEILKEEFAVLARFDFCTGPEEMRAYGGTGEGDEVYEALETIKRKINNLGNLCE